MSDNPDGQFNEQLIEKYGETARLMPPTPGDPAANVFRVAAKDGKLYYAYEFPHPSVAASVVLYDAARGAYLLIKRSTHPFFGYYAFPGGFINVGREEIEDAAVRELYEEAGVKISRDILQLIDVRSSPDRDPRDHIFDIAYYAEVRHAEAQVGEEISALGWFRADEIDNLQLAFDHQHLWKRVKARFIDKKDAGS